MSTNILSAISDIRRMRQQRPDLEVCIFIGYYYGAVSLLWQVNGDSPLMSV